MLTYRHSLLLLALSAVLGIISGHDHDKLHSHFCQGAGYSLFCPEGQHLKIFKAWYGRVAHDTTSCVPKPKGSNDTVSQPDLPEDCGSSLMDSRSSWCKNSDKGGCNIAVKDLAPQVEEKKCPESVIKYLYLEYECLGGKSGASPAVLAVPYCGVLFLLLSLVSSVVVSV